MTCGELRAKLIPLLKQRPEISGELKSDKGDLHELETKAAIKLQLIICELRLPACRLH